MARKCYVIVFDQQSEKITFEKGKYVNPWIISTKNRVVIKTTEPLKFKGKDLYLVCENIHLVSLEDAEEYFLATGVPVNDEIRQLIQEFNTMMREDYNFTGNEELSREIRTKALELANKTNRHLHVAIPAPKHIFKEPHIFCAFLH